MNSIRSIDECFTLQEITDNRRQEYEIHKANKDDYEGVLVDIYEKPTHFVYELLQNADDALATNVKFEISESELLFYHDGSKDFTLDDIKSITGVNNSTKKNTDSVGKFGIGFKSVFSVTEAPVIYNRNINFRIEHMIIPYEEPPIELGDYTTIIKLPFKSKKYSNEKIVEKILDEFEKIDCATIMFLRNISTLKLPNNEINIKRKKIKKYELIRDVISGDAFYKFQDRKTNASIAYKVQDGKIAPCDNLYIYSFLPTKEKSNLSFYVDAPFNLATTREAIDFDDTRNKEVLADIRKLFESTLNILRNINCLDEDFICEILPLQEELCGSEVYKYLFDSMADIFKANKLLPTVTNEYVRPKEAAICDDWLMVDLLRDYEKKWLDIRDVSGDVREFLIERLEIEKVNVVSFVEYVLDALSLKDMNNDWLKDFYLLCSQCSFFCLDKLKQMPILKTRKGQFKSAYLGDEEQVFRPSNGLSDSKIINHLFLSEKIDEKHRNGMQELLRILDVKERTPRQMIEMTIMVNWDEATDQEKLSYFKEICTIYNKSNSSNKMDIVRYLDDKEIFRCIDADNKIYWVSGEEAMQGNPEQRLVFKNARFLDPRQWNEVIKIDEKTGERTVAGTAPLCRALGVITSMPIESSESYYHSYSTQLQEDTCREYNLPIEAYPKWWVSKKYYINSFQETIDGFSSEEETIAMIKLLSAIDSKKLKDEVSGTYGGNAYSSHICLHIPSDFMRCLKNTKWIIKGKQKMKPYELSIDDFVKEYNLTGNEDFLQQLGLSDSRNFLPPKERRGAKLTEDCTDEEIAFLENCKKQMRSTKNKGSTTEEDDDISEDEILTTFPALAKELSEENLQLDGPMSDEDIFGNSTSGIVLNESVDVDQESSHIMHLTPEKTRRHFGKALGDYGEKRAKEILKIKYNNGESINWYGGTNKGYDYSISVNGEDVHYIDIKTISDKRRIPVTPSEWNMAKIKKEKYSFLIIDVNTGKYLFIDNPYQLYIDSKINIEVQAILVKHLDTP